MSSCDQNLDQSAVSSSTEDEDTPTEMFEEDQPLYISRLNIYGTQSGETRLKVAEMNQRGRSAGKVQRTPKFSG